MFKALFSWEKEIFGVGKPQDSHFVLVIFGLRPYIRKEWWRVYHR